MFGFKMGWIVSIIVLSVFISVMGVGIYQSNSDGNPWYFGGSNPNAGWAFLKKTNFNDSAAADSVD